MNKCQICRYLYLRAVRELPGAYRIECDASTPAVGLFIVSVADHALHSSLSNNKRNKRSTAYAGSAGTLDNMTLAV